MDGTLVPNSAETASERTRKAIERLRKSGIAFACATGRSISNTIMQFAYEQGYVTDGIFAAGKQMLVHGALVRDLPFPRDVLERLVERFSAIDDAILVAFIYGMDPDHPHATVPCSMGLSAEKVERALAYYRVPGRNGNLWDNWQLLDGMPEESIYTLGVLTAHGQKDVPRIAAMFEEQFPEVRILNAAPGWCDVNFGSMTKATPFRDFLEAEGFSADEIVFLCDSENDDELMGLIPSSVCVANAMPEVAVRAYATIPSDMDDGPAQLMEALAETGGDLDAALAIIG